MKNKPTKAKRENSQERDKREAVEQYEQQFTEYAGAANPVTFGNGFDVGYAAARNRDDQEA